MIVYIICANCCDCENSFTFYLPLVTQLPNNVEYFALNMNSHIAETTTGECRTAS